MSKTLTFTAGPDEITARLQPDGSVSFSGRGPKGGFVYGATRIDADSLQQLASEARRLQRANAPAMTFAEIDARNAEPCLIFANRSGASQFGAASSPLKGVPALPRYYAELLAVALAQRAGSPNISYSVEAAR
jgi:hypothetical protein